MKEYGKKISRYLMKNKKGRFYCVAGVLYLLAILFVMNDAWLYQTPIVKVTKVVTIVEGKSKSTRGTEETKYKQSLKQKEKKSGLPMNTQQQKWLTKNTIKVTGCFIRDHRSLE